MRLGREFIFDAAHILPGYKGKCAQVHGHTYTLEVVVEGGVKKDGMVIDFATLQDIVETEVIKHLDHQMLNDHIENPTAEHLVEWIYQRLKGKLSVYSIKLWEGPGKWVEKII